MTKRQPNQRSKSSKNNINIGKLSFEDMEYMLFTIFDDTANGIEYYNARDLTEITLGMAKIIKILRQQSNRRGEDSSRVILRRLLLSKDLNPNRELFKFFAGASMDKLDEFDARSLSNLAYAYALIDYVPEFDDGSDLFDHIAMKAVEIGAEFNAQDMSNMVWAYATVDKTHAVLFEAMGNEVNEFKHPQDFANTVWAYSKAGVNHPQLFEKVANVITESKRLDRFDPQHLSNIVWAYATANVPHPKLFEKVANHIVASDSLARFVPQALSNTVWAYATAQVSHAKLFQRVANHIVESDSLGRFVPQALSNIVWAYTTANVRHPKLFEKVANHIVKSGKLDRFNPQNLANTVWAYAAQVPHPKLFEKLANHIVESDNLNRFEPQALSNTMWAYATAQVSHPQLFRKVAKAAIQRKEEFDSQAVANLLWAYATMGIVDKQLFSSFVPKAARLIDSYTDQGLANSGWAYAVADVDDPTLFNAHFINKCVEKKDGFEIEALRQLYQWHLWQTKEKSHPGGLPTDLQERCYDIFISEEPTISKFQDDVVAQLSSIGLDPKQEVLMESGYRIDAIVEVNGKVVAVEVDGPSHFIGEGRSPTGSTILKRRQVPLVDEIELVSVPYLEWNKLGKDRKKKQAYLRKLLGLTTVES
eukprot:scaffold6582_cov83-Skeletonema_dohrnii-CCMP3373.AAC.3